MGCRARQALEAARADPWVKGRRGQLVAHPGFGVAAKFDEVARRIAAEVRLSRRPAVDPPTAFDELAQRRGKP